MADQDSVTFGGLLRRLRTDAGLTQEELAGAAGVSPRSVSDLERGINLTARRDTARLLADALHLTGAVRAEFEAVARGRRVPGGVGRGEVVAMRTLPRDISSFTGRQRELEQLAEAAEASGGMAGIHVIGGMPGVGKTAFAVHAAHQLADRFPGGQIFLPLHGHTPGLQPTDPADALASLLLILGVSAAQIPPSLEARMALWRDRVTDTQLLLVLDDAASSDQVQPLLPSSGSSLVLVTSRRHLSALDDATAVSMDTLAPEEATALLVRLAGRTELGPADPAVTVLSRLCGYLPLAIGMMARQLHHHPAWSAAELAAELAAAVDRLELMVTENLSMTAAFNLSYEDLTSDQRRLFRRLGLHLGTDIDCYAAAALDGTALSAAGRGLEALYDHYLLTEPSRGRYRFHDLIREHARALVGRLDPDSERAGATTRLLDYYQHTATLAQDRMARLTQPGPLPPRLAPVAAPFLEDAGQALAWARAERGNLLVFLDHATRTGQHARVIALTAALAELLRRDGPWTEGITRHAAALQAARQIGDRLGQGNALNNLGLVRRLTGDYPGAAGDMKQALAIYRDIGSRLGQANALTQLGTVRWLTDDSPGATGNYEQALTIYRDIGDRLGQASALSNLGTVRRETGDYPGAAGDLKQALAIYHDIGERAGQANALNNLGDVRRETGDYPGAVDSLKQALGIYRDIGDRQGRANTFLYLGTVRRETGDYPGAAGNYEQALAIYRDIGDRLGQANALKNLGDVRRETGDYPRAAENLKQALTIYRDIGSQLGQANALTYLGAAKRETGDHPGAAGDLKQALTIYHDIGDLGGEVTALNETGNLHRTSGELAEAEACHQQGLELARVIGSAWGEARALAGLGRCAAANGQITRAEALLRQAHGIFERIGSADAPAVLTELEALTSRDRPGRP